MVIIPLIICEFLLLCKVAHMPPIAASFGLSVVAGHTPRVAAFMILLIDLLDDIIIDIMVGLDKSMNNNKKSKISMLCFIFFFFFFFCVV